MQTDPPTRGNGLLEGYLSRRRAAMADRLIPRSHRNGRLLDIGCGSSPYFLQRTIFREKHGLDQAVHDIQAAAFRPHGIHLTRHDTDQDERLPYADATFDVVTMLAVIEHVEPAKLDALLEEVRRVLAPDGFLVLTTPARWTDPILKTMALTGLVSREEIHEHEQTFAKRTLAGLLHARGFGGIETGTFEWGMNLWARARR